MTSKPKQGPGTVLLIEDDNDVISVTTTVLKDAQYTVIVARTAREAFGTIFKTPPDLIILDINLPDLDGFHVAKELKKNMMLRHIPVILLSGRPDFLEKMKSFDVVVDEYLIKPFNIQDLLIRAKLVLQRSQANLDANPLTHLPGNHSIVKNIKERITTGKPYAVGYGDLNNFKAYNDKYGFNKGDEVISFAAKVIVDCVEKLSPQDHFVGHVGGDDFIFICEYEKANEVCQLIAERFDKEAPKFYSKEDRDKGFIEVEDRRGIVSQFPISSIAIGMVSDEGGKFQNIGQINHSLTQLKKYAKSFQGSAYVRDRRSLAASMAEFTWGPGSTAASAKVIENITNALGAYMPDQLKEIIDQKKVTVLFQPLIDMRPDEVMGHEGLIRGPSGSALEFPDTLFQTARTSGRVVELDILCMESILRSAEAFQKGLKLFINVYPETLLEEKQFTEKILKNPQVKKGNIIFELAGSQRASDASDLFATLIRLKESGQKICIDAGVLTSGHGLRFLPELKPDYVKLNMNNYHDMGRDFQKRTEFSKAVHLFRQVCSEIICTKLESRSDAFIAVKSGVHLGQGFLFARPALAPPKTAAPQYKIL